MSEELLLRSTSSVCPDCLREVSARVVEENGRVYLRKDCPEHGASECLLSEHAWYYRALDKYFFSVMPEQVKQRDYLITTLERHTSVMTDPSLSWMYPRPFCRSS